MLAAPTPSYGHASLDQPPARDYGVAGADGHKDPTGPCGNVAPTAKPAYFQPGAQITVKWTETIDHPGCFLFGFSDKSNPTAQTDFTELANIKHSAQGATPRPYTATVKLPNMNCTQCTLQMRQIMLANDTTACPPATIPQFASYYSCADIKMDPNAPASPDMATPGGAIDMATGTGGEMPSGGCNSSARAFAGPPFLLLMLASAGLSLFLTRRRQRG